MLLLFQWIILVLNIQRDGGCKYQLIELVDDCLVTPCEDSWWVAVVVVPQQGPGTGRSEHAVLHLQQLSLNTTQHCCQLMIIAHSMEQGGTVSGRPGQAYSTHSGLNLYLAVSA